MLIHLLVTYSLYNNPRCYIRHSHKSVKHNTQLMQQSGQGLVNESTTAYISITSLTSLPHLRCFAVTHRCNSNQTWHQQCHMETSRKEAEFSLLDWVGAAFYMSKKKLSTNGENPGCDARVMMYSCRKKVEIPPCGTFSSSNLKIMQKV